MQVRAKLPTLRIDSQFLPNSADGEWMHTELSNQISYKTLQGCRKGRIEKTENAKEKGWRSRDGWMTGKQEGPFCSNMFSPTVTLVQCNFNHEIMFAMSTDRSGLATLDFFADTDLGSNAERTAAAQPQWARESNAWKGNNENDGGTDLNRAGCSWNQPQQRNAREKKGLGWFRVPERNKPHLL